MTSKSLTVAGFLAMASAILTLPIVFLSLKLDNRTDLESTIILTIIDIIGVMILIGILTYLKQFLNSIFKFDKINRNINLLIILGIIAGIMSITAHYVLPLRESISNSMIVLLAIQGIVQIHLGYKLLKLPSDLGGLLKPFCYMNLATGVLTASVVLIPIAILVSAISDVMIGTIFFNMSRILKGTGNKS